MNRFTVVFLSLLALFVAIGAYTFLFVKIHTAAAAAAAARESAAATGQEETLQKNIQSLLADTEGERTELAGFVATDATIVSLIQEIEAAAKHEKVSTTIGAVAVAPGNWKYHEPLEISLSATGAFSALAAFATDLESLPQASHLSSANLESSADKKWFGTFTVDFVKEKTQAP